MTISATCGWLGGVEQVGRSSAFIAFTRQRTRKRRRRNQPRWKTRTCGLVDAGRDVGATDERSAIPWFDRIPELLAEAELVWMIVTHAHIDHIGALFELLERYPTLRLYCSEKTAKIMRVQLRDTLRMARRARSEALTAELLTVDEAVEAVMARVSVVGWKQRFTPDPEAPWLVARLIGAAHVQGAAMIFFEGFGVPPICAAVVPDQPPVYHPGEMNGPRGPPLLTVLHMGDHSGGGQRTVRPIDLAYLATLGRVDVAITEGTYGNVEHHLSPKERRAKIVALFARVFVRGGRVLCAAFMLGRAQELILELRDLWPLIRAEAVRLATEQGTPRPWVWDVDHIPILVDGGALAVCAIYAEGDDLTDGLLKYILATGRPPFIDKEMGVIAVNNWTRPDHMTATTPAIIIAPSGMLGGGFAVEYLQHLRENDVLVATGYASPRTVMGRILASSRGDVIELGDGTLWKRICGVDRISFSAHSDAGFIKTLVATVKPRLLYLVHGELPVLRILKTYLEDGLRETVEDLEIVIPRLGEVTVRESTEVAPDADDDEPSDVPDDWREVPLPEIEDLHRVALTKPDAWWQSRDLLRAYNAAHGREDYTPIEHDRVASLLAADVRYFEHDSVQANLARFRPYREVGFARGELLVVNGPGGGGHPRLALCRGLDEGGRPVFFGAGYKDAPHKRSDVRLATGVCRPEWLDRLGVDHVRAQLIQDQKRLDQVRPDLLMAWQILDHASFTAADLLGTAPDDDARLALALAFAQRGPTYFQHVRGQRDVWEWQTHRRDTLPESEPD